MSNKCNEAANKYINSRALAIQERPDLFRKGRGRLHWQRGLPSSDATGFRDADEGQEQALQDYLFEHGPRLAQQAKRARQELEKNLRPF